MAPDDEWNHFNNAKIAADLLHKGVSVQLGAHGQREGLGAHWEMWMFVQGGMTPLEALRCATLNGARYLGMDKDIGSTSTCSTRIRSRTSATRSPCTTRS